MILPNVIESSSPQYHQITFQHQTMDAIDAIASALHQDYIPRDGDHFIGI